MIAATCGHSASENWEALVFTRQSVTVMVVRKTAIQSIGIPFQTLEALFRSHYRTHSIVSRQMKAAHTYSLQI